MEDEKKKKKNKKKKNKQNKPAVDVTNGVGESANKDLNHASVQDHQNSVSEISQVQNEVPKIDMGLNFDTRLSNGAEGVAFDEIVENSQNENIPLGEQEIAPEETTSSGLQNDQCPPIQIEISAEETNIGLQKDANAIIQNEESMEVPTIDLRNDDCAHNEKKSSFEEPSTGLRNDNIVNSREEASLGVTSIELQNDEGVHIPKKVPLEGIGLNQNIGVDIEKEDSLDEKIKRLQGENEIHLHKEASLESKLLHLETEKDSWLHKQASLEAKLLEVEKEKDSWSQKQARLDEGFNHLVEKTDTLILKEGILEEKIKVLDMERESWLEKENSTKETMANLDENVSRLQTQVMVLEESRSNLVHENQRLGESVSGLQSQIQNLEERLTSSLLSSSMRTADDRYLKPVPQGSVNMQLPDSVQSAAELSTQFGRADIPSEFTETTPAYTDQIDISKDILNQDKRNIAADLMEKGNAHVINSMSGSSGMTNLPTKTVGSFEDVAFRSEGEDNRNINAKSGILISNSLYTNGTNEITQVPMDENHAVGPALQLNDERSDVPLTDSPIIGAPFRMISFFAKYVSGSDLVNKN